MGMKKDVSPLRFRDASSAGFTLVELAIVLMIIGLLIGGILRGQELMENARASATIQQVNAYMGASVTFQDSYSAPAGDLATALTRVPGCTAANFCGNGDGNGMIGQLTGHTFSVSQAATNAMPQVETSYFWKHLALTHLISGINPSADPTQPDWGATHPSAKVGGGFVVFYSRVAADVGIGHSLKLQLSPTSVGVSGAANTVISPIRARYIDEKMDDGHPDRGSVQSDSEGSGCDPGGRYAVSEAAICVMFFKIN